MSHVLVDSGWQLIEKFSGWMLIIATINMGANEILSVIISYIRMNKNVWVSPNVSGIQ